MSSTSPNDLIEAYLAKADDSLMAARELLNHGHPDIAASRAYYVAFYAATAALLSIGLKVRTHRGLIGAVYQHFVKTGSLSAEAGEAIASLFEDRLIGDYEPLPHRMPAEDAQEAIDLADSFLSHIRTLLKKEEKT